MEGANSTYCSSAAVSRDQRPHVAPASVAAPSADRSRALARRTGTPVMSAWNCSSQSLLLPPPSATSRETGPACHHALHDVVDLVGDRLDSGPRKVRPGRAQRDATDQTDSCVVPPRRCQPAERWYDVGTRRLSSARPRRPTLRATGRPLRPARRRSRPSSGCCPRRPAPALGQPRRPLRRHPPGPARATRPASSRTTPCRTSP